MHTSRYMKEIVRLCYVITYILVVYSKQKYYLSYMCTRYFMLQNTRNTYLHYANVAGIDTVSATIWLCDEV